MRATSTEPPEADVGSIRGKDPSDGRVSFIQAKEMLNEAVRIYNQERLQMSID